MHNCNAETDCANRVVFLCFLFDRIAGATALDKSAVPIYLPKGTYTIIAKSGGFDAGDGKVYFKAELRFVGKALVICLINTVKLHQQDIHVFIFFLWSFNFQQISAGQSSF